MKRKLILIRHASTTASKSALVGKADLELSQAGIEDACCLYSGLKIENEATAYYSSTLKRAIQTADILFPDAEFKQHAGINEIDFGEWSGLDYPEISRKFPKKIDEWMRQPLEFRFPGGESVREFIDRINDFLDSEILHRISPCVVVCHGGAIRFIICRMLNLDYSHHLAFTVHRPSVNLIDHDGKSGVLAGLNLRELRIL